MNTFLIGDVRLQLANLGRTKDEDRVFKDRLADNEYNRVKMIDCEEKLLNIKYTEYRYLAENYETNAREIENIMKQIMKRMKDEREKKRKQNEIIKIEKVIVEYHFWQKYGIKGKEYEALNMSKKGMEIIEKIIIKNPYRILEIEIATCDNICNKYKMNIPREREKSIIARRIYENVKEKGWTCTPEKIIRQEFSDKYKGEEWERIMRETTETYKLIKERECWYGQKQYKEEKNVVSLIGWSKKKINEITGYEREEEYRENLDKIEDERWVTLSEEQKEALIKALINNCCLITGGAGTGKTYVLAALIRYIEMKNIDYKILTFTGKASSRVKQSLGKEEGYTNKIQTIHKFLNDCKFSQDEIIKLPDIIIFDESSMIPITLLSEIYELYMEKGQKGYESDEEYYSDEEFDIPKNMPQIVLLGDPNQLPPIQYGQVLEDLINSKQIAHQQLTRSHRFDSELGEIFEKIPYGLKITTGKTLENYKGSIINYLQNSRKSDGFNTTILCFYNKQLEETNLVCQKIFNPQENSKLEYNYGGYKKSITYREGDRVMMTVNNYHWNVMNGEEGKITKIEKDHLMVKFGETREVPFYFDREQIKSLERKFALSVHDFYRFMQLRIKTSSINKKDFDDAYRLYTKHIGTKKDLSEDLPQHLSLISTYYYFVTKRLEEVFNLGNYEKIHAKFFKEFFKESTNALHISNISHSWAMTVHKSQGSEWQNVIVLCPEYFTFPFVNRKLIYTALTRTRSHSCIIGRLDLVNGSIKNIVPPRYSNLSQL